METNVGPQVSPHLIEQESEGGGEGVQIPLRFGNPGCQRTVVRSMKSDSLRVNPCLAIS